MSFFATCVYLRRNLRAVWPPNGSLYASSTCVHLRLLVGPFGQGFTHSVNLVEILTLTLDDFSWSMFLLLFGIVMDVFFFSTRIWIDWLRERVDKWSQLILLWLRTNEFTKKNKHLFPIFYIFVQTVWAISNWFSLHGSQFPLKWPKRKEEKKYWKTGNNRTLEKERIKILCSVELMSKWPDIRYLIVAKLILGGKVFLNETNCLPYS